LKELAPDAGEQNLRNFLGQWYFVGDRAFESVDGFSGGERARLALALIAYQQPNVLLLDEPTNHLDIDMREALAEALSDFDGAIVLVSHDRHLIGLVSETFWRVADGGVDPFNGDLDEYAIWLKARSTKIDQAASKARTGAKAEVAAKAAPKSQAELGKLQKQVEKLERQMADLDSQLLHIQEEMAKPELYLSDGGAVLLQLGVQQQKLEAERARIESDWLQAYESLEQG
jgi:ATP-binding cassette subfamily F protein 3